MPPTILPRRYAPAASVQSSYLTLSGCKLFSQGRLLSQGRPGVRQARHQRRRQALRRQNGISVGGNHCDDNDAQPDASAAATSTSNTTMHNPAAFHTAGVTATCSTLARLSTRTTQGCKLLSQGGPGVRLARHRRRRQAQRRQRCTARRIGGCDCQRQALRIQRCTARPLFTRPALPRRALRSHDYQRALRKLSVHAVALCSPCAHHFPTILPGRYARRPRRTTLARLSTRIT